MFPNLKSALLVVPLCGLWACDDTGSADASSSSEPARASKTPPENGVEQQPAETEPSECERVVRHIYAFTEATAVGVSDAELAIMTKVVMGATELCERDGLTPEVQACVMAVRTYRALWDLPACQGMPELAPAWLREIGGPGPSQPYPTWADSTPEEMRIRLTGGSD